MKLRHPFLIQTAAFLGAAILRRLLESLAVRIDYGDWGRQPTHPRNGRFIYVFWHETLLLPLTFRSRTHILISDHADGELIAQVSRYFGFGTVRGSSTRGGVAAVRELIRTSERGHLCVTPDGPRGPRRKAQPGAVFLASQTGLPIVPVGVGYASAWRARSWDQFAVPKPFSQARAIWGEPIVVPKQLAVHQLKSYVRVVQQRMTDVTTEAEQWAEGKPRKTPAAETIPYAKSA